MLHHICALLCSATLYGLIADCVYGSELAHHQCCYCGVVSLLAFVLVPARVVRSCCACSWIVALPDGARPQDNVHKIGLAFVILAETTNQATCCRVI